MDTTSSAIARLRTHVKDLEGELIDVKKERDKFQEELSRKRTEVATLTSLSEAQASKVRDLERQLERIQRDVSNPVEETRGRGNSANVMTTTTVKPEPTSEESDVEILEAPSLIKSEPPLLEPRRRDGTRSTSRVAVKHDPREEDSDIEIIDDPSRCLTRTRTASASLIDAPQEMLAIPQKRESDTDASTLEDRRSKRVKVELIDEDIKPTVVIKKRSQSPEVSLSHPSPPPLTPPRECVQEPSSGTRTEPSYHIKAEVLLQTAPILKPEPSIERADMEYPSPHPIPPRSSIELSAPMVLQQPRPTPLSAPPASSPTARVANAARSTKIQHTISSAQTIPSPALMKSSTRQAARPVAATMTPPITDSLVPSPRKQMSSSAAQSGSVESSIVRHPAVSSSREKHVSTSTEAGSLAPVAAVTTMIASHHIPPTTSPTTAVVLQVAAGTGTMSSRQQSPKTAITSRLASGQLLTAASSVGRSSTLSSFAVATATAPAAAVGSTTSGQPVPVTVPTPPTTHSGTHHPDKTVLAPRGGSKLGIPSSASIPPGATASEIAEAITAANVGRKFHIPEHRELASRATMVSRIYDQETPSKRELQPSIRHRISSPATLYYHPSPSPSTTEDEPCLCFICGEDGHKAIECEGTWNSYATWQEGLVIASSGDPICYYFNLHSDICIYGDECRREHVCSLCGCHDHGCCENAC